MGTDIVVLLSLSRIVSCLALRSPHPDTAQAHGRDRLVWNFGVSGDWHKLRRSYRHSVRHNLDRIRQWLRGHLSGRTGQRNAQFRRPVLLGQRPCSRKAQKVLFVLDWGCWVCWEYIHICERRIGNWKCVDGHDTTESSRSVSTPSK